VKSLQAESQAINRAPESDNGKKKISVGLQALDAAQVMAIERALREVGEFGEIHLIVRRGQIRFIGTLKTEALMPES